MSSPTYSTPSDRPTEDIPDPLSSETATESVESGGKASRGDSYVQALDLAPTARDLEIQQTLDLVAAREGDHVLDYGCGTGVLTFPISNHVGPSGCVYAVEDEGGFISKDVAARCREPGPARLVLARGGRLPLEDETVDTVCSLATMHHVPDKLLLFQEFSRVLRPQGRVIIADVARNTNVQRYFDEHVHPHCSTGHDLRFLGQRDLDLFCDYNGLEIEHYEVRNVPWSFDSASLAGLYLKSIFDLSCEPDECLNRAKRFIGFSNAGSKFILLWRLFFFVARKVDTPSPT